MKREKFRKGPNNQPQKPRISNEMENAKTGNPNSIPTYLHRIQFTNKDQKPKVT